MVSCASQNPVKIVLFLIGIVLHPVPGAALAPDEVVVIANERASDSLDLAQYYMRRRHIPSEHLVRLDVTAEERCSRQEYDEKIRKPVRRALAKIDPEKHIRSWW